MVALIVMVSFLTSYIVFHSHGERERGGRGEEFAYLVNPLVKEGRRLHHIINFKELKDEFLKIRAGFKEPTYIYFAYLNNLSWVGLDEKEMFTAASTIKVPLAMTVLRAVEEGRLNLSDKYILTEEDLDENFGDFYKQGAGKEFTLKELLEVMLKYSDNTAMRALFSSMRSIGVDDPLAEVYGVMGWDFFAFEDEEPQYSEINVKTLSNMFLSLYNATFINVDNSNLVLSLLAETPFTDWMEAGVPSSVLVSHKIGIAASEKTMSDCGIVYAPYRPYLLCMGIEGASETRAASFFKSLSEAAYDFVMSRD